MSRLAHFFKPVICNTTIALEEIYQRFETAVLESGKSKIALHLDLNGTLIISDSKQGIGYPHEFSKRLLRRFQFTWDHKSPDIKKTIDDYLRCQYPKVSDDIDVNDHHQRMRLNIECHLLGAISFLVKGAAISTLKEYLDYQIEIMQSHILNEQGEIEIDNNNRIKTVVEKEIMIEQIIMLAANAIARLNDDLLFAIKEYDRLLLEFTDPYEKKLLPAAELLFKFISRLEQERDIRVKIVCRTFGNHARTIYEIFRSLPDLSNFPKCFSRFVEIKSTIDVIRDDGSFAFLRSLNDLWFTQLKVSYPTLPIVEINDMLQKKAAKFVHEQIALHDNAVVIIGDDYRSYYVSQLFFVPKMIPHSYDTITLALDDYDCMSVVGIDEDGSVSELPEKNGIFKKIDSLAAIQNPCYYVEEIIRLVVQQNTEKPAFIEFHQSGMQ